MACTSKKAMGCLTSHDNSAALYRRQQREDTSHMVIQSPPDRTYNPAQPAPKPALRSSSIEIQEPSISLSRADGVPSSSRSSGENGERAWKVPDVE